MVNAYRPKSLSEALEIRRVNDVMIINGGTDVMVKHSSWPGVPVELPKDCLYIGHMNELKTIDVNFSEISIGAAVTYAQFLSDLRVSAYMKAPIEQIGSVAIRNIATIAGNVCNASPAGDTLPMLYALDAKIVLESLLDQRIVKVYDFIQEPAKIDIRNDEIVTKIIIPIKSFSHSYYRKVKIRKANAISKVSLFALANIVDDRLEDVRIAIGSCGPTVVRAINCEVVLKGLKTKDLPYMITSVLKEYNQKIIAIDDVRSTRQYRSKVALNLIETFIMKELSL